MVSHGGRMWTLSTLASSRSSSPQSDRAASTPGPQGPAAGGIRASRIGTATTGAEALPKPTSPGHSVELKVHCPEDFCGGNSLVALAGTEVLYQDECFAVSTALHVCLPTRRDIELVLQALLCAKHGDALKTWCCCDCGAMGRMTFCGSRMDSESASMQSWVMSPNLRSAEQTTSLNFESGLPRYALRHRSHSPLHKLRDRPVLNFQECTPVRTDRDLTFATSPQV